MMRISTTMLALMAGLTLGACAGGQTAPTASSPAATQDAVAGTVAQARQLLVTNTIVRVEGVPDEALIRRELEEYRAGLYWTRGTRSADALIQIGGERDRDPSDNSDSSASLLEGFGESDLFGTVSLLDPASGAVIVGPVDISVSVTSNRDAGIGLANTSRADVRLEYLVQKFITKARETLYGPGV